LTSVTKLGIPRLNVVCIAAHTYSSSWYENPNPRLNPTAMIQRSRACCEGNEAGNSSHWDEARVGESVLTESLGSPSKLAHVWSWTTRGMVCP
ncbi:hypothetical protein FQN60_018526, partial [Etheostoma spectabile]